MFRNIKIFLFLLSVFINAFFGKGDAIAFAYDSLDPAPYFLTPEEITYSRAGVLRNDINPYTLSGNWVDLLINDQFFTTLYHDINATKEGDFIWITSWDIHKDVMLMPDPENRALSETSRIQNIILAAIKRKVNIRILINTSVYNPFRALGFCKPLNKAAQQTICAPDIRHNDNFGSLHQKTFVIKRNNETVAYTGGIDIAEGRYDNSKHDSDAKKLSQPPMLPSIQNYYGWSDGMLYIKGSAVLDIARHLYQQFDDPISPFPLYTFSRFDWPNPPIGFYNTNTQIQTLFTAAPAGAKYYNYYSNWAPSGELSILAATLKAIYSAKDYIFIADQFLWYAPILNAIAEKADQVKAVVLLTNPADALDQNILGFNLHTFTDMKSYYQYKTWEVLLNKPNVFGYQMIKEGLDVGNPTNIIYSHWKILLIDDRFAIIGTAGAEQASMVNDLEVNVGVFDPIFVTEMRQKLWGEYLNIPDPKNHPMLQDPVQSIFTIWQETAVQKGRVRNFWPKKTDFQPIYKTVFNIIQPCGYLDKSLCQE